MTTKTETHTPTPWIELADGFIASQPDRENRKPGSGVVAEAFTLNDKAFIVRAVNAYDRDQETIKALLKELKSLRDGVSSCLDFSEENPGDFDLSGLPDLVVNAAKVITLAEGRATK